MSTEKQRTANRQNAEKSTGPATPEGKARASVNALRHGFRSREAVLPEEDRAEFEALLAALEAEYAPAGPTETFLVRELASTQWRLLRHSRIETGLFLERLRYVRRDEHPGRNPDKLGPLQDRTEEQALFDNFTRQMGRVFYAASNGDAIGKLNRYENTIRRGYYKALSALLEAQARRLNPPAAPKTPNEPNSPEPQPAQRPAPEAVPPSPPLPGDSALVPSLRRAAASPSASKTRANRLC